jgi:DNA-binding transcriptional ArsR family regulator
MPKAKTRTVKQLDPTSVRVLAHPLRVRIVGELRIHGPATATILAGRLGESSGATSYHLRVLAEHGFVEEDSDRGTGRERWWRAAQEITSWRPEDFRGDAEAEAAEEWLIGHQARRAMEWIDEWLARRPTADPAWVSVADQSDYWLRMTPDQVKDMIDDVHAVILRHIDETGAAAQPGDANLEAEAEADPAARLVRLFLFAVPQLAAPPAPDDDGP